jgi:hypothetical protein
LFINVVDAKFSIPEPGAAVRRAQLYCGDGRPRLYVSLSFYVKVNDAIEVYAVVREVFAPVAAATSALLVTRRRDCVVVVAFIDRR